MDGKVLGGKSKIVEVGRGTSNSKFMKKRKEYINYDREDFSNENVVLYMLLLIFFLWEIIFGTVWLLRHEGGKGTRSINGP